MLTVRLTFALLFLFTPGLLHPPTAASIGIETATAHSNDLAYAAGTKALNESRWSDAIGSFDQVIQTGGRQAEAALYWKAYALNKLGKPELAIATCEQLATKSPKSSWNRDCVAMRLTQASDSPAYVHSVPEVPNPSGPNLDLPSSRDPHMHAHDANADLKILALNSLLHTDPAQAVPMLLSMLTGDQTPEIKRHALFVLAQSRSNEAEAGMRNLLMGRMGPELQRSGIKAAGVYEGRRLNDTLVAVYKSTSDPNVKQAVASSLFVSNDDSRLVDLAHFEKNINLRRSIVSQLSLMNGKAATDYMLELLK